MLSFSFSTILFYICMGLIFMSNVVVRKCKDCGRELEFWEWNSVSVFIPPTFDGLDLVSWSGSDVFCDSCYKSRFG